MRVLKKRCFRVWTLCVVGLAIGACSDASESQDSPCADSEVRSPVTGACIPADKSTTNNPTNNSSSANAETGANDGGTNNETTPAIDMGNGNNSLVDAGKDDDAGTQPPPRIVRFVAIGDTGTGSDTQKQVGQSIGTVCTALGGCDFGMLLGDNVYDSGVSSVDDALFQSYFVVPYGHLGFPFYAVLGNHDLGGDGLGLDLDTDKGAYQIGYSQMNPMWKMPAEFYQVDRDPVWMVGLNTTDAFFSADDDQRAVLPGWLASAPPNRWKIAFGHHPYISNGRHGNAGEYEGLPFVPIANGEGVKRFIDDHVCGNFDIYLSGHDHNRQDLGETCGTTFIVSGAGAKTTDIEDRGNTTFFEEDTEGFAILEITPSVAKIQFYDANGVLEHERSITR